MVESNTPLQKFSAEIECLACVVCQLEMYLDPFFAVKYLSYYFA